MIDVFEHNSYMVCFINEFFRCQFANNQETQRWNDVIILEINIKSGRICTVKRQSSMSSIWHIISFQVNHPCPTTSNQSWITTAQIPLQTNWSTCSNVSTPNTLITPQISDIPHHINNHIMQVIHPSLAITATLYPQTRLLTPILS